MKRKICTKCKREQDLSNFRKRSEVKSGLTSQCKKCMAKTQRARLLQKNPNARKFLSPDKHRRIKRGKQQKLCSSCNKWKSLNKFYNNTWRCKKCCREYRQSDRSKVTQAKSHKKYDKTTKGKVTRAKALKKYYTSKHGKAHRAKYIKKYLKTFPGRISRCLANMKTRCNNPKFKQHKNYSDRNIQCLFENVNNLMQHIVCDLGISTVEELQGLHVHRINNDGNYERGNIVFLTQAEHIRIHAELRRKELK